MRIQIIKIQNTIAFDEVLVENVRLLWHHIKHEDSAEEFTWIYAEEIDSLSDVYFEIISAQKLKVGILPTTVDWIADHKIEEMQFNDLHWITVEGQTFDQLDLFSDLLRFIIGMICIPSQMGTFMTDLADQKTALQYGNEAKYISFDEFNNQAWLSSVKIASCIMLLNEDSPMSKKLEIAAGIIPKSLVNKDYLSIVNMTNSNLLPQTNMLLLVYKK